MEPLLNPTSPIILLPLFKSMSITTVGTSLTKSSVDLNVSQFTNILPRLAGIFVIGLTENVAAADLEWNVNFIPGFDRQHEGPAIDIASADFDSTLAAGVRSAEYTSVTAFLPSARLQVWWRNKSGVSGVKTAVISGILGIHLLQT